MAMYKHYLMLVEQSCKVLQSKDGASLGGHASTLERGHVSTIQFESYAGHEWEKLRTTHVVLYENALPEGKNTYLVPNHVYDLTTDRSRESEKVLASGIKYRSSHKGVKRDWEIIPISPECDPETLVGSFLVLGPMCLRREFHDEYLVKVCEEVAKVGDEFISPMWNFEYSTNMQMKCRAQNLVESGSWTFGGTPRQLDLDPDGWLQLMADVPQSCHQFGRPLNCGWEVVARSNMAVWTDGMKSWVETPVTEVAFHPFDWKDRRGASHAAGVTVEGRHSRWETAEQFDQIVRDLVSGDRPQVIIVNGIPVDELVGQISAQVLYDLREKYEFCSGTELADFFSTECGEPSPSGRKMISGKNAQDFVLGCIRALAWNSGS